MIESDCYGAIDVNTGKTVLFIPKLPKSYQVWMGEIYPPSHFQAKYDVDEVHFVDDVSMHSFSNIAILGTRMCKCSKTRFVDIKSMLYSAILSVLTSLKLMCVQT